MDDLLLQSLNSQSSSDDGSDGSDHEDFSNNRCGICKRLLGCNVGIYIYSKRDVKDAEIVLCDCCADFKREKIREEFWVSDSDPGECNFHPNWKDQQIMDNMVNLHLHSQLQQGRYVGTPPSKDLTESCIALVVALQTTSDDEIRGDIALAFGQQNEETRHILARVGACLALVEALTLSRCDDTRDKIDFSVRSLARHSNARTIACAALVDALALTETLSHTSDTHRSRAAVAFVIKNLSQIEENRGALIEAGAFPALVAAAALERDDTATRLFSDAITSVSCDAHHRVHFIRTLLLRILSDELLLPPALTKTAALQTQLRGAVQSFSSDFEAAVALSRADGISNPVKHSFMSRLCEIVILHLRVRVSNSNASDFIPESAENRRCCSINLVIGSLLQHIGVLVTANDAHEANFVEGMRSVLSHDAISNFPDPWSPYLYLNAISRRILVVKRPGTDWIVTVDCTELLEDYSSPAASLCVFRRNGKTVTKQRDASCALIAPLREHAAAVVVAAAAAAANADAAAAAASGTCHYSDALCAICQSSLFEIKSDGSIIVLARQLKCFTTDHQHDRPSEGSCRHMFHAHCTRQLFIQRDASQCPVCRYSFGHSQQFSVAAALDHQVLPGGLIQWAHPLDQQLRAIRSLETGTHFSAFMTDRWGDETARTQKLATVLHAVIHNLRGGSNYSEFLSKSLASLMKRVVSSVEGWAALMQAGACASLVAAVNATDDDFGGRDRIVKLTAQFCEHEDGCAALVQSGMCSSLVAVLDSMANKAAALLKNDDSRKVRTYNSAADFVACISSNTAHSMSCLYALPPGRAALIQAGLFSALAATFASIEYLPRQTVVKGHFASLLRAMSEHAGDAPADVTCLIQCGACVWLVAALVSLNALASTAAPEYDRTARYARFHVVRAIQALCYHSNARSSLIECGVSAALVAALTPGKDQQIEHSVVDCMFCIADDEDAIDGHIALVQAGSGPALTALYIKNWNKTYRCSLPQLMTRLSAHLYVTDPVSKSKAADKIKAANKAKTIAKPKAIARNTTSSNRDKTVAAKAVAK